VGWKCLGFFRVLEHPAPEPISTRDREWFYRRGLSAVLALVEGGLARLEGFAGRTYDFIVRRPLLGAAALLRELDARVIDATAVGVGRLTQTMSQVLRFAVSGHTQHYGLLMALGILAAIALAIFSS